MSESKWTGSVLGLIGCYLICSFITGLTLFIGTPWAVCYAMNYIAEHMTVSGKKLTFNGTGGQLIGTFIKWWLLCIVTLGIYSFWIPNNLCQWITKHVSIQE